MHGAFIFRCGFSFGICTKSAAFMRVLRHLISIHICTVLQDFALIFVL